MVATADSWRVEAGTSGAELVARSLSRPEVFGELYERHVEEIHRYLARRVGVTLADDLAAETFLLAFQKRERYDPGRGEVLPWLFGIATNLLRRHWRQERAQYRSWERTGVDPVLAEGHDQAVTDRVAAAGTARQLARLLRRLPAPERDVLLLVAWAGLTYEQAASATGSPVGTVRSRLHRARSRLRAALDLSEEEST